MAGLSSDAPDHRALDPAARDAHDQDAHDQDALLAEVVSTFETAVYVWQLEDADDPAGIRLVYANHATEVMTGIPVAELQGRPMRELFPRSEGHARMKAYAEVAQGGPARDMGDVVYSDDRMGDRTFAVRLFPLSGQRVGVLCSDVTAQRATEAAAVEILDSMSDLFSSFDHEFRYTFINAVGEHMAGLTREQIIGRCIWDVYPGAVGTKMHAAFLRAEAERTMVTVEEYFATFGQWVSFRIYPTPEGIAVYAQDVTARRRLDEQASQAQKMTAVSTLAGGVAHDFNNALTAIRTAAQLALTEDDDAAVRRDLEHIDLVAEHAASLTRQLLTISRTEPAVARATGVNALLGRLAELLAPLVGDDIVVTTELAAKEDLVPVGGGEIQQVLLNLCLNARDAMPEGGALAVRTADVDLVEAGAELAPGRYVLLEVADTGCGMDPEARRRAFDPFFTTKPTGSGLGLASVYGIVRQGGGAVELDSEPGAGTTVRVLLPLADGGTAVETDEPPGEASTHGEATVLVVEDDEHVRPLVVRALRRAGFAVLEAVSGPDAVAVAEHFDGVIDLLLTDVVMPGMGGGELAACLRRRRPDLRVLFMSGHAADLLAQKGVREANAAFLAKPFRIEALADKVRSTLAGPAHVQEDA